ADDSRESAVFTMSEYHDFGSRLGLVFRAYACHQSAYLRPEHHLVGKRSQSHAAVQNRGGQRVLHAELALERGARLLIDERIIGAGLNADSDRLYVCRGDLLAFEKHERRVQRKMGEAAARIL